ncbi:MAG: TIGR00730 family Rossman fold protein [Desulfococcaceae bacterium]
MRKKISETKTKKPLSLYFHRSNGQADRAIENLIDLVGGIRKPKYIREMIIAALKAGQEDENRADLRLMNTTLKEMRFTGKVFGPYRHVKKVTVFGSARTRSDEPAYRTAVEMGRKLREAGYMVITGGGPGIMQAVNEGAGADYSFGVNIRLPFEQKNNPVIDGNPKTVTYKYFFNRKVAFVKEAHAVVLFPGGFGTLDEAMETLMLVQTGKRNMIPLIFIDPPRSSYWARWLDFIRAELTEHGFISPDDFNLFVRLASVEDTVAHIRRFYYRYHSLRYVREQLLIRMLSEIPDRIIAEMKEEFADILIPGGTIRMSCALPEESEEPEIAHLPRLLIDFNRISFGRLRLLIDRINSA